MFVWVFHRISGILLVVLLPLQLLSGVLQGGTVNPDRARWMTDVHRHDFLNGLLAFLVVFHGAYGVRNILLDLGVRRERLLFWACTLSGAILFAAFLVVWRLTLAT